MVAFIRLPCLVGPLQIRTLWGEVDKFEGSAGSCAVRGVAWAMLVSPANRRRLSTRLRREVMTLGAALAVIFGEGDIADVV